MSILAQGRPSRTEINRHPQPTPQWCGGAGSGEGLGAQVEGEGPETAGSSRCACAPRPSVTCPEFRGASAGRKEVSSLVHKKVAY